MMANFEDDLFSLLWTEIDFDDHPICGGHGSEPEGELEISVNENCIIINDNRIEMILAHPDAFHNEGIEKLLSVSENSRKVASAISEETSKQTSQHVIFLTERPEMISNPPEKVHSSTLPRTWIGDELAQSEYLRGLLSKPLSSLGESAEWRYDLWSWREDLSSRLPGWTWHLEFANKSDRLGWYIRAPGNTLFTVFLGWGGLEPRRFEQGVQSYDYSGKHGFFLFERAPLGQFDRPDEAEANRADHYRTRHLLGEAGQLTELVNAASRGDVDLVFTEILVSTDWASADAGAGADAGPDADAGDEAGAGAGADAGSADAVSEPELWPLVIARCPPEWSGAEVGEWFGDLLRLLRPAIDYVSMT